MREIRQSGSEGGGAEFNRSSLPLSLARKFNEFCGPSRTETMADAANCVRLTLRHDSISPDSARRGLRRR